MLSVHSETTVVSRFLLRAGVGQFGPKSLGQLHPKWVGQFTPKYSLDEVLAETPSYSPDLKALVLRMIHQQQGNLGVVATQTGLPKSTLYSWLADWNMAQQTAKKKR